MISEKELLLARRVATRTAGRWSLVDAEDAVSHLWVWLFEHVEHVKRYRSEDGGEGKLYVALRREAAKYCAREQAARSGGPLDDGGRYTVEQIQRALPFVFEGMTETLSRQYASPETETAIGIMLDLQGAFNDIPAPDREVLTLRFRDGLSFAEIGALLGLSDVGARNRVTRGVKRMLTAIEETAA